MKKMFRSFAVLTLAPMLALPACVPQTSTEKGAVYGTAGGAALGAIAGQAIGRDTKGTLIGAAIGAALGGLGGAGVGKMMDKQEQEMQQALSTSNAAAVRREGDVLAISLRGDVTFDTASATVRPGLYSEVDRIANILNRYPDTVIQVEGHTDSQGAEQMNMDLSQRRADAVKSLLVQKGVNPNRIETAAFGESMPVADNNTSEGRARNRRVEIKVAPSQYQQPAYQQQGGYQNQPPAYQPQGGYQNQPVYQQGGYPSQGGYPQQQGGYPQSGYPSQGGYPNQRGGYPSNQGGGYYPSQPDYQYRR